jgi:diaminohydroxyphosphoribosylaminopyrimidine deaminase/5-amino-6-(5-phosphoribosylamino)uracil reductase
MTKDYSDDDARWMARALSLARRGEALTSPNPMVGCVVVREGRIAGEGFHTYDGLHHAEILALRAAGEIARGSTLYANLEPCGHTGRTGPCTGAIIAAGVERVVAAMRDPNPRVAGRGLEQLRRAGIEVAVGEREAEASRLNEAFACWIRTGRPMVTLKTAMSLDAKIALPPHRRKVGSVTWVTSAESRAEVQNLRHAADALLTGIGTVLADDPRLTDRTGRPRRRRLLRVILDSKLRLPLLSKLARSARGDVLVFTRAPLDSPRASALRRAGVELVRVTGGRGPMPLDAVLDELGRMEILSVLVEGGTGIVSAALAAGVVDKLVAFVAPTLIGADAVPLLDEKFAALKKLPPLREVTLRTFGPDFALEGYFRDVYGNR